MAEIEKPEQLEYESNDRQLQFRRAVTDHFVKKTFGPPDWLKNAETPFKWLTSLRFVFVAFWDIPEKLIDYKNQGPDYGFEKYTLLLSLIVQRSIHMISSSEEDGSDSSTSSNIEESPDENDEDEYELEKCYIKCKDALDEMAAWEGDVMYNRIGPALEHVLQATRAHMLYFTGNLAESQEIATNIQSVEDMSTENQAGIEGIKAKFILAVYREVRVALSASQKAMELDPYFAAWKYLTGKIIRRLRRDFKEEMPREELEYFEKAVELERNPKYIVFLAQAYQEMAQALSKRNLELSDNIDEMLKKAADLYRECWSLKSDSAAISRRVGNGMMKMKTKFMDLSLAKEALLKAVELSSNVVTIHELGRFYYKYEQDDERALECFEKVGKTFGTSDLIRLNVIKYPDYDPHDIIEKWVKDARTWVKRYLVYCDAGWYYLSYKRNIEMSVKCFWKVFKEDCNSFRVTQFQSYTFCVWGPLNMIKILVNEILLLKEENKVLPPEKKMDMWLLETFLEKIMEKHPEMVEIKPDPDLFKCIRKDVEKSISRMRQNRYGYSSKHKTEVEGSWRNNNQTEDKQPVYSMSSRGVTNNRYQWKGKDGMNSRGGINNACDMNSRDGMNMRGGMGRQYNNYNNSRYDVTITDWRSENRTQNRDNLQ